MNRLFIVVPTIEPDDNEYITYLEPSLNSRWKKNVFCIDNTKGLSMFEKYNYAVNHLIEKKDLTDDDIILFTHSDVTILDQAMEDKLRMTFDFKTEVGIIGIYGTTQFNEQFGWWLNDRKTYARGHIQQGYNGTFYHMFERVGYFDDVVVVDGCFFAVRGKLVKQLKFRDMDGYHQYENSYCIDTLLKTDFKVAVADIFIQHESEGPVSKEWYENGQKLFNEYSDMGMTFPLTTDTIKLFKQQKT